MKHLAIKRIDLMQNNQEAFSNSETISRPISVDQPLNPILATVPPSTKRKGEHGQTLLLYAAETTDCLVQTPIKTACFQFLLWEFVN